VGCAQGWFLDIARNYFDVAGIEPDTAMLQATTWRGLPVRSGYSPDALAQGEEFDVIVFNDVIEHFPDIKGILGHCHAHLAKDGLLVLNLPSSGGVFYRLSKLSSRCGFAGFFERLWQKDLPSPHVHCFNASNLAALLRANEFAIESVETLSTLRLAGLYTRVAYTGNYNRVTRLAIFSFVALCLPLLWALPSDIIYVIARPRASAR
jgi:SAM-dependent methyltransferase